MSKPLLTVMIPTTIDRREMFVRLVNELQSQRQGFSDEVEIIWIEDNKEISVGKKRQRLLEDATGEWVVGFDSDDWPAETYLVDIITALKGNPQTDHVGFLEDCDIDGEKSTSIFSIQHCKWDENKYGYDHIRCANPKSVIRRSIALQVGFEDSRFGEDRVFSEVVTPLLASEVFINKPLYKYIYRSSPHNERYGIK
jgi:hypothetical protein